MTERAVTLAETLEASDRALQGGDGAEAEAILRRAVLHRATELTALWGSLGTVLGLTGTTGPTGATGASEDGRALALWDGALAVGDPNPIGPVEVQGIVVLLSRAGRFDQAIDVARRSSEEHPDDPRPLGAMGLAMANGGRGAEGADALARSAERWLAAGVVDAATFTANLAVNLPDAGPGVRLTHARVTAATGDVAAARARYEEVLAADPGLRSPGLEAEFLRIEGRTEEALGSAEAVLAASPGDLDALATRASALRDLGRLSEALVALEQGIEAGGGDRFVITRASLRLILGDPEGAMSDLEAVGPLVARAPLVLLIRAELLMNQQRLVESAAAFDHLLEMEPGNALARAERAQVLYLLGRTEEAEAEIAGLLAEPPTDARVAAWFERFDPTQRPRVRAELLVIRSRILLDTERYEEAHRDSVAALEVLGPRPDVTVNLARAFLLDGNAEEALRTIEEAPAMVAAVPEVLFVKASALVGLDRPEDAIAALSTALSANPDNPEYLRFRAAVRLDVGRPDEAIDDLAELEKRAPDSADVQHLWANAFVALGRSDAAIERFGRAEELGGDPDVYIDHAVLLSELDRPDEAIALSRVGVERFPEDAELLALLGKLLADRGQPGDHRDAVDNLTRAFERQPRDPADVAESIGESLRQQGKSTEALAWLDRALAIQPDSAYGLGTKGQVLLAIGGDGAAEQALELFRRAVALSGDDPPGWLVGELVDALSDDGSTPALEEGLSHIDRYIGRGYHEAWILARRAETLRLLERAAEGLEAADAALAAAGTGDEATEGILGTKAHLLCDLGRPDEALEVADHLLELAAAEDRTNAFALSARIRALTTSDRHAEATLAIDRYLEIEEADPWALTMRASVLIEYGDFQGALDVLNAIAPGDPYRDGLIGYCSVRLGDPEPALAALERAVAGAPRLWWCWNEIGLILLERQEREEAGKRFRVVLDGVTSSAGADPDLIANAAWSACLDEDPTTAVGLAQRSVALERDRCGNRLTLGTALLLADRKLAALDEFEAAETMAKGLRDPRRAAALLREAASDLELLVRLGRLDPAQPEVAEAIELLRSAAERLQPATTADV